MHGLRLCRYNVELLALAVQCLVLLSAQFYFALPDPSPWGRVFLAFLTTCIIAGNAAVIFAAAFVFIQDRRVRCHHAECSLWLRPGSRYHIHTGGT